MALKVIDIKEVIELMAEGHPRYEEGNDTGLESIQKIYDISTTWAKKLFAREELKGIRITTPEFVIIDSRTSSVPPTPAPEVIEISQVDSAPVEIEAPTVEEQLDAVFETSDAEEESLFA